MPELKINVPDPRAALAVVGRGLVAVGRWATGPVATALLTVVLMGHGGCLAPLPPAPGPPAPGPGPVPPQPPPIDPLVQSLATAWAQETHDALSVEQVQLLAAVYRHAAVQTANDPTLKTCKQLLDAMHGAAHALLPDAALPHLRKATTDYLDSQLGTNPAAPIDRMNAAQVTGRLAVVLGGLK